MKALDTLQKRSEERLQQDSYIRRGYSTTEEAHARVVETADKYGLTISVVIDSIILDTLPPASSSPKKNVK